MEFQGTTQQGTAQPGVTQPGTSQPGIVQGGMAKSQLAFHETMEIHELLNFKTICMVQSKMASGLVFDQDLKALLEKDVQQSMVAINQLKSVYSLGPQLQ
jgi:similar to spore coat protein